MVLSHVESPNSSFSLCLLHPLSTQHIYMLWRPQVENCPYTSTWGFGGCGAMQLMLIGWRRTSTDMDAYKMWRCGIVNVHDATIALLFSVLVLVYTQSFDSVCRHYTFLKSSDAFIMVGKVCKGVIGRTLCCTRLKIYTHTHTHTHTSTHKYMAYAGLGDSLIELRKI